MAIYHNGNKIISLYHKGKKIESVYHNGIKIYSSSLPIGTILWYGRKAFTNADYGSDAIGDEFTFFYDNFLLNKKITLSNAISECQNGIVVNFSKLACIQYGVSKFYNTWIGNIRVPKSFSNKPIYTDGGTGETVSLIKSNDSTVYFHSTNDGDNSTNLGYKGGGDEYLYIDSITAY